MTQEEIDPAEEYFRTLERMADPDDSQMRMIINNAREDYRQRSRYTPEYWKQRETYLREQAMKRWREEPTAREIEIAKRFRARGEHYKLPWWKRMFIKRPQ